MGLLTLTQLRSELRIALGGRDDQPSPTLAADDQLNLWLNMGYSLVCQPEVRRHFETRTRYQFTLATGVDEYLIDKATVGYNILGFELVEFFDSVAPVVSTRRVKLDPRPIEWFSNNQPHSTTGGPRFYTRDGNLLRVSPWPAGADNGKVMRLSVYREPSPLVADGDTTVLLDYFDNAVVMAGEYFAKLRLGYRELAINTRQELQVYCNQKLDAGETDTDPGGRAEVIHESPMGWS